jgi:small GTP-binding protein
MEDALKVVLLGESGVGKTSIIAQFVNNKFDPDCISSLTAQFVSKIVEFPEEKKAIKFDIWDTAGQEKFRSLAKVFYKDAKIVILVYEITNTKSFEELQSYWYNTVKETGDPDAIIAIVGNKNDLYSEQKVAKEEGEKFAKSIGAIFQLTSAKNDSGITELFKNIGKKYFDPSFDYSSTDEKQQNEFEKKKIEQKEPKKKEPKGVQITVEKTKKKPEKKCC